MNFKSLLLILIMYLVSSCAQKNTHLTQPRKMQLKKITCYQHDEIINQAKPSEHIDISDSSTLKMIKYFSNNGNLEKETHFNEQGEIEYTIEYKYDISGRLLSEIPIDTKRFSQMDYKYFDEESLTICTRSDNSEIWHYYHDNKGNRVSTQFVNSAGDVMFRMDNQFDSNELLVATERFDNEIKTQTQTLIYDENKRLIETQTFDIEMQLVSIETQNFINQNDVEKITKNIKKGTLRKSRMIQFNDAHDNKIKLYMMSAYKHDTWKVTQYINEYY